MTDYLHVWEIMKNQKNDKKQRVLIERPASNSETEPLRKVVYDGYLKDVPPRVALERVLETSYSVVNDCPVIVLYGDSTPEESEAFKRELIEAAAEDPEIARKISEYLQASDFGQRMMESKIVLEMLES